MLTQLRHAARRKVVALLQEIRTVELHDIEGERQRQSLLSTVSFMNKYMSTATPVSAATPNSGKYQVLERALQSARLDGLVLEFGVATGDTLRRIAAERTDAHGFDSFEGLPEDWRPGFATGAFAQRVPEVGTATLHIGWFQDSLPRFLSEHPGPFAFVHIEADLYSSTKIIFELGESRFVNGTVIVFDEYFNYPGWEQHEHQAFVEFIEKTGHAFEYLTYNPLHEQVAVRLIA